MNGFYGFVMLKMMPKPLVTFVMRSGLFRFLFTCFKYTCTSLQEILDDLTDDKDLHMVLSYCMGDYGAWPFLSPPPPWGKQPEFPVHCISD